MANRKTPPAQIVGESLGPMSDQDRAELAAGMRAVALTVTEADKQFGDGQEYSLDRCLEMVDVNTTILERATLQIGRYFNWMKEREPHGAFTNAIETRTKYSVRSAQVFMGLSRALCAPDGEPLPLIQYLSSNGGTTSKSKLIELSYLHPDDLARLGAGEEVKGVTREQIKVMTAREVAEAFAAKDEVIDAIRTSRDKLLSENEKLERDLAKAKRGGLEFQQHAYAENIADVSKQATHYLTAARQALQGLESLNVTLLQIEVPPEADRLIKRDTAQGLHDACVSLGQRIAEVIDGQRVEFAAWLNGEAGDLDETLGRG